jgi:integrase
MQFLLEGRALWMVLFEGGLRISEGLGMNVGSLVFDSFGCYAIVDGMTGVRRVRFVQASPYLREYLSLHPGRDDPSCPLWVAEGSRRRLHGSSVRRNLGAS